MKHGVIAVLLAAGISSPGMAALQPGAAAPAFDAQASLAGKTMPFSLGEALRTGPVVVYFYPAAYTKGCDIEAHGFAEAKAKFEQAHATIIGVSNDGIARLNKFSADPAYCAGKFPVASDADGTIAAAYGLKLTPPMAGVKDSEGVEITHGFIERTTFVVGKDGRVVATLSSADDKLSPLDHVDRSLIVVEQLAKGR